MRRLQIISGCYQNTAMVSTVWATGNWESEFEEGSKTDSWSESDTRVQGGIGAHGTIVHR